MYPKISNKKLPVRGSFSVNSYQSIFEQQNQPTPLINSQSAGYNEQQTDFKMHQLSIHNINKINNTRNDSFRTKNSSDMLKLISDCSYDTMGDDDNAFNPNSPLKNSAHFSDSIHGLTGRGTMDSISPDKLSFNKKFEHQDSNNCQHKSKSFYPSTNTPLPTPNTPGPLPAPSSLKRDPSFDPSSLHSSNPTLSQIMFKQEDVELNDDDNRNLLGKGVGGKVYRGTWRGSECAFKNIPSGNDFYKEVKTLIEVSNHNHICRFFGILCREKN
eukprot:UN33304